jgi:hypothetical protein
MSKQILSISFKKENGKLTPANKLMLEQYKLFVQSLPDNATVDCMMELKTKDNTKAQLAKIHVCIKEIADEQGDTVEAVKQEVKRQCGMAYKDENGNMKYDSFKDCSKQELSNVIETIIQMGHFLNVDFRGTLHQ